jgi:hypothetical protein
VVDAGVQASSCPASSRPTRRPPCPRDPPPRPAGARARRVRLGVTDVGEALLLPMVETAGLHHAAGIAAVEKSTGSSSAVRPVDVAGVQARRGPVMTAIASVVRPSGRPARSSACSPDVPTCSRWRRRSTSWPSIPT